MNENETNEVKGYRIEITTPEKVTKKSDGTETRFPEEKITCFYLPKWYTKEELDYGNYFEYSDGILEVRDENDAVISEYYDNFSDLYDVRLCELFNLIKNKEVNPGDFFEKELNGKKVRIIAISERPRICVEKCYYDEISYVGRTKIKIYGKPLDRDGIFIYGNKYWKMGFSDTLLSWIREKMRIAAGEEIDVEWRGNNPFVYDEGIHMYLTVKTSGKDALIRSMSAFGDFNYCYVDPKCSYEYGNDGKNIRRCVYEIIFTDKE